MNRQRTKNDGIRGGKRMSRLIIALALLILTQHVLAATTDLATAPIAYLKSSLIRPNIYFILDDSSSMAWSFLGDEVIDKKYQNAVGYRSNLCNKIYYDPQVLYEPPVREDGTSYPDQNFSAALYDGYQSASIKINLAKQFMAWRSNRSNPSTPDDTDDTVTYNQDCKDQDNPCSTDTAPKNNSKDKISNQPEPAYYFLYKGSKPDNLGDDTTNDHCKDTKFDTKQGGSANWVKVVVNASSGSGGTDETQNFANWYSYYRTRMMLMKTAVGHAFSTLDDNFRIGFSTISYQGVSSDEKRFLEIAKFDLRQKKKFYEKLYGTTIKSGTPLRTALVKAGRLYAGKISDGANDPLEYSCQRNFSILSSDGYWNDTSYVPVRIDGATSIDNQDNNLPRPKNEGPTAFSGTLADVAAYYFHTDLRTPSLGNCGASQNLCENNVPVVPGREEKNFQQMITYTLGLGVNGVLKYQENYDTALSGDYRDIVNAQKNWPDPINNSGGERIDDLWHAAVNGGGKYFRAQNADALAASLSATLQSLRTRVGTAAAAATSNQEPIEGDNILFTSQYRSVFWDGDLIARSFDLASGSISNSSLWSASDNLDRRLIQANLPRKIYLYTADNLNRLKDFLWSELNDTEKTYFSNPCNSKNKFSQCSFLTKTQADRMGGKNLLNYLRGSTNFEDRSENSFRYYRRREHVLGALINARPLYIGKPAFRYADDNYASFRDVKQGKRKKMIYAAANDGMLHAFNAENGHEEWAFIPPAVLPEMISQADFNWSSRFRYLLDGSPVAGDICPYSRGGKCEADNWKTILVGGLAGGGRQFYALDVTDPVAPKALWVFDSSKDPNLGYSFGKPLITKRTDGRWVVILTSGYNNIAPGDGKAYLYVLDAETGDLLDTIATNSGSRDTPSGLAQINSWVDSPFDNTAQRIYGGDLTGKLWRFDINNNLPPEGKEALLLASFIRKNEPQPITTRPELSEVRVGSSKIPVISIATGKYLGLSDIRDTKIQSVYTFKDPLTNTGLGNLSESVNMAVLTLSNADTADKRTMTGIAMDWKTKNGWYFDLAVNNIGTGERVTLDIEQQSGILRIISISPFSGDCNFGGRSWMYTINYRDGMYLSQDNNKISGKEISSTKLIAGFRTIKLGDTLSSILTDEAGAMMVVKDPAAPATGKELQRVSWRELEEQ